MAISETIVFSQRSLATANYSPWVMVWSCLHDPVFSCFSTIPACDRQANTCNTSIVSHGKNKSKYYHYIFKIVTDLLLHTRRNDGNRICQAVLQEQ